MGLPGVGYDQNQINRLETGAEPETGTEPETGMETETGTGMAIKNSGSG